VSTISQLRHELDLRKNLGQEPRKPPPPLQTATLVPVAHDPMAWFSRPLAGTAAERDGTIRRDVASPPDSGSKPRGPTGAPAAAVASAVKKEQERLKRGGEEREKANGEEERQPSGKAEDDLDSAWLHFSLPPTPSYAIHSPDTWSASRQACLRPNRTVSPRSACRPGQNAAALCRDWPGAWACFAAESRGAAAPNVQRQLRAVRHEPELEPPQPHRQSGPTRRRSARLRGMQPARHVPYTHSMQPQPARPAALKQAASCIGSQRLGSGHVPAWNDHARRGLKVRRCSSIR
jgi:hypothetical protein